jgi:succinoglycan biosynthesis protein ExoM
MSTRTVAPRVSLIIPTQRRPGGLTTAVRSAFRQTGVDLAELELVVVDNDQLPSARATVEALSAEAPFPVIYVHEPEPGVANARNAAMAKARGALIASLDDDEEAPEGWLAALLEGQARFSADVVFGPVRGRAPPAIQRHRDYLEWFFSRPGPAEARLIDWYHGCGNSLVARSAMTDPVAPFNVARNFIGGEDDLLFGQMQTAGARFAWAPDAWVWEDPQASRLSLAYAIPRAFAYGQGPTEACAAQNPPDRVGVARWMAIGLLQAGAYGLLAGFKRLTGARDYAFVLDKAARGLGKTLWWGPFKIPFYGQRA